MREAATHAKVACLTMVLLLSFGDGKFARSAEDAESIFRKLNEVSLKYQASLARAEGRATIRTTNGPRSDPKIILGDIRFHRNDGRTLVRRVLHLEKDPATFREVILASDGEHQFLAERLDPAGAFGLKSFRKAEKAADAGYDDFYPTLNRYLLAPVSLSYLPSTSIQKNPHFKLGRAEKLPDATETYRVHYELNDPGSIFGSGWFEVGPATGWLIRKSSCRYGNLTSKNRSVATLEYGMQYAGQSVPRRVHIHQGYEGSDRANDDEFTLTEIVDDTSTASEFRTANYGIPDPSRLIGKEGGPAIGTLLLILSPALLLAAMALRLLARRYNRGLGTT